MYDTTGVCTVARKRAVWGWNPVFGGLTRSIPELVGSKRGGAGFGASFWCPNRSIVVEIVPFWSPNHPVV